MTDSVITAEEVASYLVCPRQYEFEHTRLISPRSSHRDVVWEARRELLATAIIAGLTADVDSSEERAAVGTAAITDRWSATSSAYLTAAQETFDKTAVESAIAAYFDGIGSTHADNLVEADTVLSNSLNGVTYEVNVDAVVHHDGRHRAIRFVPDLTGVHPSWKEDGIVQEYRTRQAFYPRQVGHLVRAGTAIRGLMTEHGLDSNPEFEYVSLLSGVKPDYSDGGRPAVTVESRSFSGIHDSERADLRGLLDDTAPKILADGNRIPDSDFESIREQCCEYCPYRDACPEYIESAVSFTTRTQNGVSGADGVSHPREQPGGDN